MIAQFTEHSPDDRRVTTEALIAAQQTDVDRWSDPENLKKTWAHRAQAAARLVPPRARILDIGCGGMDIERFLDPSVTYLPADIVKRDDRTITCDLNAGEMPDVLVDVISLLGVLEYIHDVPALLAALRRTGATVITSYNPLDLDKRDRDRRAQGWFNDFTSAELCGLAVEAGFSLVGLVTIEPQQVYELRPA